MTVQHTPAQPDAVSGAEATATAAAAWSWVE